MLLTQCVTCHDLKTILTRPRTPGDWVRTVERMANRQIFEPIEESEQWAVSAYLIAISPELQTSAKARRVEEIRGRRVNAGRARGDGDTRGRGQARRPGSGRCTGAVRGDLHDVP